MLEEYSWLISTITVTVANKNNRTDSIWLEKCENESNVQFYTQIWPLESAFSQVTRADEEETLQV